MRCPSGARFASRAISRHTDRKVGLSPTTPATSVIRRIVRRAPDGVNERSTSTPPLLKPRSEQRMSVVYRDSGVAAGLPSQGFLAEFIDRRISRDDSS